MLLQKIIPFRTERVTCYPGVVVDVPKISYFSQKLKVKLYRITFAKSEGIPNYICNLLIRDSRNSVTSAFQAQVDSVR